MSFLQSKITRIMRQHASSIDDMPRMINLTLRYSVSSNGAKSDESLILPNVMSEFNVG